MSLLKHNLVPTRVGMILSLAEPLINVGACPHTRGDDPIVSSDFKDSSDLSPHAWG